VRHFVVPSATDPFLDLGAGEVVGQLAWVDHLLATQLDERFPGLRSRIRHEAWVRVLEPFAGRRDWHWLGLDGDVHNWNPWIHGNVLVAALRLVHDPAPRAQLVALVIEGIDFWSNGEPPRKFKILGVIDDTRGGGFDPTNNVIAGDGHIRAAVGREIHRECGPYP